jgi:hypothetical protein
VSDQSLEAVSEAVSRLENIGFEPETPHRISYFSAGSEDSPIDSVPAASYIVETDAIGVNTSEEVNSDDVDTANNIAHELVHYNASNEMFGETSDEFKDEVGEFMEAREAFIMLADGNGYDLLHDPEIGKDHRLNPLHLEAVALATEDINALSDILAGNSGAGELPLGQIGEEADGLLQKHYPNISQRRKDVYESGALPFQESITYFTELYLSGVVDGAVRNNTVGRLESQLESLIAKDFSAKPDKYFGVHSRERLTEEVTDAFGEMVSQYQNLIYEGLDGDEAAELILNG